MIVARLAQFGKLGGFHFNDSKYGDDDLDSGSINPFQLFLVFNELADAAQRDGAGFKPAYMLDQSHNVTDPIESLMNSAVEVQRAFVQAALVDRAALAAVPGAATMCCSRRRRSSTPSAPTSARSWRWRACARAAPPTRSAAYRASGYRDARRPNCVRPRPAPAAAASSEAGASGRASSLAPVAPFVAALVRRPESP